MSSPEGLRIALVGLAGLFIMLLWGASLSADAIAVGVGAAQQDREPAARVPVTAEDWEAEAPSVRNRLRRKYDLPAALAPQGRVVGRAARDGYVRQVLQLDDGAGLSVKGRALIPQGHVGRGPAVLYVGDAETAARFALGEELARRGYLVFEFNARDRSPSDALHDDLLALHYVLARRDVDPERVAVCGAGPGGIRAMLLAALQPKVAMAVSLCPHDMPSAQVLGLIAPRPLLLCAAEQSDISAEQARAAFAAGGRYYRLYDLPELFRAAVLPAGSRATKRMRQEAAAWLAEEL